MAKKQLVCDTDVMIDYWDTKSKRHFKTKEILEKEFGLDNIFISAITKMELLIGAGNKENESKIQYRLQRFNIALINNNISEEAIELIEKYRLSHGLAIPDAIIAATTKIIELELFTYNIKDYRFIDKLKLYNYN